MAGLRVHPLGRPLLGRTEFARRVIALRRSGPLSRRRLAARLGVSWRTVERWEQGSTEPAAPVRLAISYFEVEAGLRENPEVLDFSP